MALLLGWKGKLPRVLPKFLNDSGIKVFQKERMEKIRLNMVRIRSNGKNKKVGMGYKLEVW